MTVPHLAAVAEALGIGTATRHLFLCAGATNPKCCPPEHSLEVWAYLKRRIVELDLEGRVLRTKADCLRICALGPICVVYPDGVWYHSVSIPVMERILQEHVVGGDPVREHVIAEGPLVS